MFVVSAGNEKQTKQARDAILYAVIGLIVSAAAFAITSFINTQLGT
jgi:multisubunit Na+/H+ antiporter MnhB subunit